MQFCLGQSHWDMAWTKNYCTDMQNNYATTQPMPNKHSGVLYATNKSLDLNLDGNNA